jgi:hypothetical protein
MAPTDACPRAGTLHLAQAQSNEGPRGRKRDFPDAERLVKRLVAQELTLSFVPDITQRLWRTVARRKYQSTCNRVQRRRAKPPASQPQRKTSRNSCATNSGNPSPSRKPAAICLF